LDVRKSLNDYNYYIGSATLASDYETTTECVINYIKKTFDYGNDIGIELKELTPNDKDKWKVSMKFSMSSDELVIIELLRAIKEYNQNFQEHCYSMSIILDSLRSLLNLRQREGKTLQDWTKRFKTARDIFESHLGGPMILTKIVEMSVDFDPLDSKKVKRCEEREFEISFAFLYLENADRSTLLTGHNTQQ
jgi:hypothetical protein